MTLKKISFIIFNFFYLLSSNSIGAICQIPENKDIKSLLQIGASLSQKNQTDFGRYHQSYTCYLEVWPHNTEEVTKLVSLAYGNHLPIRIQGAAHSENGSSLPHAFELLIHTTKLNQITFDRIGRVTVGAGIPVALVKILVEKNSSFFLPVANDGDIAPTVGGYISAGGIGPSSLKYGGFWEHVFEITLVTGKGKVLIIRRDHPLFPYIFGSMGQLGIITQVKLNLLRDANKNYFYPLNQTAAVDYPTTTGYHWTKHYASKSMYWLNLFVAPDQVQEAKLLLSALQKKYPHALAYKPIYLWPVTYISLMPPLLYDKKESFIAIGIWGNTSTDQNSLEQFKQLQHDFSLVIQQKKYKSYIQTEIMSGPNYYKNYFPETTFREFKKIKSTLDPEYLFNKGSVF